MSTKLTTNITEGMIHFLNCLTECQCCHVSLLSTGPSFPIRQGDFLVTSGVVKIFLLRIMHVLTTVSGKLQTYNRHKPDRAWGVVQAGRRWCWRHPPFCETPTRLGHDAHRTVPTSSQETRQRQEARTRGVTYH